MLEKFNIKDLNKLIENPSCNEIRIHSISNVYGYITDTKQNLFFNKSCINKENYIKTLLKQ